MEEFGSVYMGLRTLQPDGGQVTVRVVLVKGMCKIIALDHDNLKRSLGVVNNKLKHYSNPFKFKVVPRNTRNEKQLA